jgi:predicted amidophosphoribosyltransferase
MRSRPSTIPNTLGCCRCRRFRRAHRPDPGKVPAVLCRSLRLVEVWDAPRDRRGTLRETVTGGRHDQEMPRLVRRSRSPLASRLAPLRCPACGGRAEECGACLPSSVRFERALTVATGLESCWSLTDYVSARALVLALKRRGATALAPLIGAQMAAGIERISQLGKVSGVTWAPTSAQRARARGFDQSEVIAAAVAEGLGVPAFATLERVTVTAQHGLTRTDRLVGPRFEAFVETARLAGQGRVLLIDDVATTGATLEAAGATLARLGISPVAGVVVAVAPELRSMPTPSLRHPARSFRDAPPLLDDDDDHG